MKGYDVYVDPDVLDGDRLIIEDKHHHDSIGLPHAIGVDKVEALKKLIELKEEIERLIEDVKKDSVIL